MKILLVNWMDPENPQAGGAEVHLTEIFSRFVLRGDEVTLVSSGFPGGKRTGAYQGIDIVRTGTRETFNFTAPSLLRRLDSRMGFDIVVEDINKVPLFAPLFIDKPVLVVIPHLFGSAVFRETNALAASYVYLMEKPIPLVYRKSLFEVISESTANDVIRRGIRPENVRVVHCGLDHETYSVNETVGKFDRPTVLYLGRIKRYKSVDVAVRAMPEIAAMVPDARLVVAGSGDAVGELKRLAASLGVADRVEFTGFVSREEKVDLMRRSHVVVNPSPREGWGLTNVEAAACGTPAVASDADGLRDSVRDGVTGRLFPYGDHRALAELVGGILTDDAYRRRLGEQAARWALTFTWDKAAHGTMEVVDDALRRGRKS